MGTTLEGKQINQTYQGLLKTTDNAEISGTAKEITDGKGNGTGVTLDNSGNLVANATVTANAFVGDGSSLTNLPAAPVTSVNTQTGNVVLDTDDIAEGFTNEYYTDAKVAANSAVAANTAKVGITTQQASDITANNAKISFDSASSTKLAGIESGAEVNTVDSVNTQTGAVVLDTDDISEGINQYFTTVRAVNAVTGGNLDMGSYDITTTGKIYFANVFSTEVDLPNASTYHGMFAHVHATGKAYFAHGGSWHKLLDEDSSNTDDLTEGVSNLYYTDARVSANTDVAANTAKVGITSQQAADIVTNNAKVGITTQQANDIVANNAKVTRRPITAGGNTLETSESLTLAAGSNVTITEAAGTVTIASTGGAGSIDLGTSTTTTSVTVTNSGGTNATISEASGTAAGVMSTAHHDKLDGIAAGAEVNTVDSVNGATGVVSLDTADLTDVSATAPTNGQVLQYNSTSSNYEPVTLSSTAPVDSVNGQTGTVVLDADDISDAATINKFTTAANLTKLGNISVTQAVDLDTIESDVATNNAKISFDSISSTKLGTIEENADVTDTANVTAAGALMDSEVDADIKTLALPANTTISTFAKTILDDIDASAVRTTIGAGTSNLTLGTTAGTALEGDTVIPTNNNQLTNGAGYITGNETVTLSGDITGSGATAITASISNNVVGADELNVSGNGTLGQVLASDGDSTFSWVDAGGSYTPNIVSAATTASKDNLYIFTASATLTLPASPSAGDSIKISNLSGTTTCVIARNTNNIMAVSEDMTLDNQYASFELIYGDATRGWVVVGGN